MPVPHTKIAQVCRVGKIVHREFSAWARREDDFAHASRESARAFAHPTNLSLLERAG